MGNMLELPNFYVRISPFSVRIGPFCWNYPTCKNMTELPFLAVRIRPPMLELPQKWSNSDIWPNSNICFFRTDAFIKA